MQLRYLHNKSTCQRKQFWRKKPNFQLLFWSVYS